MEKEMKNRILLITYGVVLFLFIYNYQWLVNYLHLYILILL